MKIWNNILEIQHNYKGFVLDIWGVLHASGIAFEGVLDSLTELKRNGKKILLLSNAPRRSFIVEEFLQANPKIIKGKHYDDILTSGEVFFKVLKQKGRCKIFHIGSEKDASSLQSSDVEIAQNESECDFAVVTGFVQNAQNILAKLKNENKVLYCINPDIFITKADKTTEECAGFLALEYKKIGGEVVYFGKPYIATYEMAMLFFEGLSKQDILAVGDGMETDILGANQFGIDSALCLKGLPSLEINANFPLESFLKKFNAKPTFVIQSL